MLLGVTLTTCPALTICLYDFRIIRLRDFSEWGQCQILELLMRYSPSNEEEVFDILVSKLFPFVPIYHVYCCLLPASEPSDFTYGNVGVLVCYRMFWMTVSAMLTWVWCWELFGCSSTSQRTCQTFTTMCMRGSRVSLECEVGWN